MRRKNMKHVISEMHSSEMGNENRKEKNYE